MYQPRLGVSLHTISTDLTDGLIAALDGSPIATVEISAAVLDREPRARAAWLGDALRSVGIRPMSIHARFGQEYDLSSPDAAIRRAALASARTAFDLATALGAPMVVMHASAEPIAPSERAQRMALARAALAEVGSEARQSGKRIAVEILPRTCLGNTVEELFELLGPLDADTFGVCLDTNHLMDRYRSLADAVRALGDRLLTTHLSDYDGVDEQHALPGSGVLDWGAFLRALEEIGYHGPFNYECGLPGETVEARIRTLEENYTHLVGL